MSLRERRRARQRHECGWMCGDPIEPGTVYVRSALPPHMDPNDSDGWWVMALHSDRYGECPSDLPERHRERERAEQRDHE